MAFAGKDPLRAPISLALEIEVYANSIESVYKDLVELDITTGRKRVQRSQRVQEEPEVLVADTMDVPEGNGNPLGNGLGRARQTRPIGQGDAPNRHQQRQGIVPPPVQNHNFEIKLGMINLVQNKMFHGLPSEDPIDHLDEFDRLCDLTKINGVSEDAIKLRLFPMSLADKAHQWEKSLPHGTITTWDECKKAFLAKFFSTGRTAKLRGEISSFIQRNNETFAEAWERYREMLDTASNGNFLNQDVDDGWQLVENMAISTECYGEHYESTDWSSTAHSIELDAQMRKDMLALNSKLDKLILAQFPAKHVNYCIILFTTRVCPSSYTKKWEQFPSRGSPPQIAVDIDDEEGEDLVDYADNSTRTRSSWNKTLNQNSIELEKLRHCKTNQSSIEPEEADKANSSQPAKPVAKKKDTPAGPPPYKPPLPFPGRFKKQLLEAHKAKFDELMRQLELKLPFIDALMLIPPYQKFLKDAVQQRTREAQGMVVLTRECSAIIQRKVISDKKEDPGSFTLPCMLGPLSFKNSLCDLGSSVSLMPLSVAKRLGYHKYQACGISLVLADRSIRLPTGMLEDLPLRIGNVEIPTDFIVLEMDEEPTDPLILGRPFLATARAMIDASLRSHGSELDQELDRVEFRTNELDRAGAECKEQAQGDWSELKAPKVDLKPLPEGLRYAFLGENSTYPVIVNSDLEPEQLSALLVELRKYRKAIGYTLDDIKGISPDLCIHRIHLEDESKSSIEPQRRLNPNLKEVVKKEILKLLDAGIIYPISDSTWISPVHCVPKKGGITVIKNDKEELIPTRTIVGHRMCIDYRKLNSASRKDHFPLPFIDQMLERLANHPFYCFLDGYSGFFQIPIHPNDQEKTTFTCPYGTFAYRRMPFGLCNAPATFQRCMTSIFSDLIEEMVEVFMDDFSVYGASFSSCLSNLCRVLQRCEETNLVLNWEKCHFMVREGIVLGHKISEKGIELDRAKVDVMLQLPVPKTVKDIRSFLGHAGFYRRFIKDFSKIARPLTRLLCKETDFEFDEECHKSWTLLKDALVSAPIVQAPNWDHPFEIMCDASDYAVGAVLGQKIDKKLNVIYYASKTMDDAQCKYATTEKELLAIVFAFEKFRSYIVGSKVIVHTDHAALRHIFAKKIQSQDFSDGSFCFKSLIEVVDKKGVENGVADHLSRMRVEDMIPINDSMPEEQLMAIMILKESFDEKARLEEVKALRDENLPWYADIVNFMVSGEVPSSFDAYKRKKFFKDARHYYWDEPYLYKRGPDSIYRRCIAEEDVQGVLEHCHGSAYGGHFATFKTATKVLQSGLWWPTLFKDAADYIAKCDPCQRKGGITKRDEMPLNPILEVEIFDVWGIDFMGPFKPSSNGHNYILVAVDYVSKWIEAIPCPTCDAKVVVKLFRTIIFPRFGIPRVVISDGGSHFINKVFEKLMRSHGVKHKVATPYHPQTSGQVEVSNRQIKAILEKTVSFTRKDWAARLDEALWAYRTATKPPLEGLLSICCMGRTATYLWRSNIRLYGQ
ncbi:unnamed protein product [Microthlaspi erraticum]|uniref:Integrase catalytic domain-containing protein n=1 Tax=Microthlaspi erraticum TaxID=1685480 RepID=A0A6D2L4U0_9BRAS|nr:unnamed protein product [Microthlaspi erraticum]